MAEKPDFQGRWHNQKGSEMELEVRADGSIRGSFRSAVGAVRRDQSFPLVGQRSGDLIGFCVQFGEAGVAAWTGQHTESGGLETIETLWHLAQDIPPERERDWLWSGVRSGADRFVRGPSLKLA
jgi:hypothetical protein